MTELRSPEPSVEPTIESVTVGEVIGPLTFNLEPGDYPDYVDSGAISPGWLQLPDGRQAAPHSLLFEAGNRAFSSKYLSGRKLNAGVLHRFYAPLIPPSHLATTVEVLRTYVKRGREHVEFVARVHDDSGRLLMASHNNWVMNSAVRHEQDVPPAESRAAVEELDAQAPTLPVSPHAIALAEGEELPPLQRNAMLNEPPGGFGPNSVHGDEYAQRVLGTRGGIVLGSTLLGYVNEQLGRALGASWLERGSLDVRIIASVVRNDLVTAQARVAGRRVEAGLEYLEFEVSVTNEVEHRTAVVGTARYLL